MRHMGGNWVAESAWWVAIFFFRIGNGYSGIAYEKLY